ncbi:hypothetical protein EJB05_33481, partial [Eragrostis curvula]
MFSTTCGKQFLLYLLIHAFIGTPQLTYSAGVYSSSNRTAIPPVRRRCLPDQAMALLRLKRSFNTTAAWGSFGNGPICTLGSWQAGSDCCAGWEGVRCGDGDGRITVLDLGECGLESSGGVHPALFDLTSLRHLNLAWNNFNGSQLPVVGFERLTELIHLNLSSSGFAGRIPDGIKHLSKLVSLDLSNKFYIHDQFDELVLLASWLPDWSLVEPDIGSLVANLSNLKELYLGKVDLSGNAPGAAWCSAFANATPELHVLSLPYCRLRRPICGSLSAIHSLTEINLAYNFMYGRIPESSADIPSLSVLILTYNELKGWFPEKIFQNKNLTTVDIRYNEVSGSLPNFSSDSILKDLLVSSTNFSGPIPGSISNIKSLNKLGLASTHFSQELPSSIGELKSLSTLEVSGAGIVGTIPYWITNLTSLLLLQFSNCGVSGEIPSFIGNLRNLTRLQLYKCNFSGTIPPQIFNMTKLRILYLHSNNFVGMVELSSFWKLPRLISLLLSNNKLTVVDTEENSSVVNEMESLGLASCKLSQFPSALKHMHYVVYLDLSHNQINGSIPQWAWESWNDILILNVSHNRLNNLGYGSFLPRVISVLDLSSNLFEGPIPLLGNSLDCSNNRFNSIPLNLCSHLRDILFLKASRNSLSGPIPPTICDARNLELLDLSYNNLSGLIPSCLMDDLHSLGVLNLKANQLHGRLPQNIKHNCAFEDLNFSDNRMEGQLPRSLAACRDLQVVDIGNNKINDTFPCWMSKLPKLQVLVLKHNKFVGTVGREDRSCEFPKLRILDLSSNGFFGTLPKEWFKAMASMMEKSTEEALSMRPQHALTHEGSIYQFTIAITYKGSEVTFSKILRSLVVIDVSDNSFHGGIPDVIGGLVQLSELNMSHNALTGHIPSHLGALNQLESLDLSSNYLSREIPRELASLHFLSTLNLSYNKLVGRIPESPQFLTYSNLSFLGNIGLCGLQVSVRCNNTDTPNVVPQPPEKKSVDIVLFLMVGLGYGVGFAVSIVVTWGIRFRKRSQGRIFIC